MTANSAEDRQSMEGEGGLSHRVQENHEDEISQFDGETMKEVIINEASIPVECADVPEVSNAERSDDLSKVVFQRKHRDSGSTVAVQAGVQLAQDGRRQQGLDSEMQVEQNSLSFSRMSEQ